MATVHIKTKVSILTKQSESFSFTKRAIVKLNWATDTDLDLCIFFKKKDGGVGGVFSNEYRGRKSDLGYLDKFPFIKHSGDEKKPVGTTASFEEIKISNLEELESAYILVVNYTAALNEDSVTFNEYSGKLLLQSDNSDQNDLEINVNSTEEGQVYYVGKISKEGDNYSLSNEGKVLFLGDAFEEIPGFELITKLN